MPQELIVPPGAVSDPNSTELIRAWVAHKGLHCSLNVHAWDDEKATIGWGILLSDIARHVADALHESKGWEQRKTLLKIREVFNAELSSPTAETGGSFI